MTRQIRLRGGRDQALTAGVERQREHDANPRRVPPPALNPFTTHQPASSAGTSRHWTTGTPLDTSLANRLAGLAALADQVSGAVDTAAKAALPAQTPNTAVVTPEMPAGSSPPVGSAQWLVDRAVPVPDPAVRTAAARWLAERLPTMVVVERGTPRRLSREEAAERVARELPDSMVAAWAAGAGREQLAREACARCGNWCPDPQCGDSTWDHDCELGMPCPEHRACPAHGTHPHNGMTCLDCPVCRPGGGR